jgi:hypothetical protein
MMFSGVQLDKTRKKQRIMASARRAGFTTEASAAKLKTRSAATLYCHATERGFCVMVYPSGQRDWMARYGLGGKDTKKFIGAFGTMRYGDAMTKAAAELESVRVARKTGAIPVPELADAFKTYILTRTTVVTRAKRIQPKTVKDYRERFGALVPEAWHHRRIDEITPDDWLALKTSLTTTQRFIEIKEKPMGEFRFDGF